jgi:phosphate acetyltransferase
MIDPLERARALQFEDPPMIALAEGEDSRVWEAAEWAAKEGFCHPVVVTEEEVHVDSGVLGLEIIRPSAITDRSSMAEPVARRLESIGRDPGQAEALLADRLYFTCGLVAAGLVDGAVMGAASTTADTVRACLVPEPDAETLAEIAIAAAESCRVLLSTEPRVALLGFSTKGSAEHSSLHKIREACRLLGERRVDFEFDGELQADAALVAEVAKSPSERRRTALWRAGPTC